VIVPCKNGASFIRDTADYLDRELPIESAEIIIVENGSTDGTFETLTAIVTEWAGRIPLVVVQSKPGLGYAYACGISTSRGELVYLTADDVPFGIDDLALALQVNPPVTVIIGSKGHPDSVVDRSMARSVMTSAFRSVRRGMLGSRVRDSQGTFILDGDWARAYAARGVESGFLWTTELVDCAEQDGMQIREIPIVFHSRGDKTPSRVRVQDAVDMVVGTWRIRARRGARRSS
jgi:glycosyltransferase involved in cell wall biosynthesis